MVLPKAHFKFYLCLQNANNRETEQKRGSFCQVSLVRRIYVVQAQINELCEIDGKQSRTNGKVTFQMSLFYFQICYHRLLLVTCWKMSLSHWILLIYAFDFVFSLLRPCRRFAANDSWVMPSQSWASLRYKYLSQANKKESNIRNNSTRTID